MCGALCAGAWTLAAECMNQVWGSTAAISPEHPSSAAPCPAVGPTCSQPAAAAPAAARSARLAAGLPCWPARELCTAPGSTRRCRLLPAALPTPPAQRLHGNRGNEYQAGPSDKRAARYPAGRHWGILRTCRSPATTGAQRSTITRDHNEGRAREQGLQLRSPPAAPLSSSPTRAMSMPRTASSEGPSCRALA